MGAGRSSRGAVLACAALLLAAAGCSSAVDRGVRPPASAPEKDRDPLRFRAQELPFTYDRGETGAARPVETTGGGVGLIDYDGDGRLDLFFAQGGPRLPRPMAAKRPGSAAVSSPSIDRADVLLRNLGGGRFEDVSATVGLAPGDTARAWPWRTMTATAIPTST